MSLCSPYMSSYAYLGQANIGAVPTCSSFLAYENKLHESTGGYYFKGLGYLEVVYLETVAAAALCPQANSLLAALMASQPIQSIVNPLATRVISIHKELPVNSFHLSWAAISSC